MEVTLEQAKNIVKRMQEIGKERGLPPCKYEWYFISCSLEGEVPISEDSFNEITKEVFGDKDDISYHKIDS